MLTSNTYGLVLELRQRAVARGMDAAAKAILVDIMAMGLTPELRERGRLFLEDHPD